MNRYKALYLLGVLMYGFSSAAQSITDVEPRAYGSYASGSVDMVDLRTGNVMVHIPLISYPQLGTLPPLSFSVELNNAPYFQGLQACDAEEGCVNLTGRYDTSPPGTVYEKQPSTIDDTDRVPHYISCGDGTETCEEIDIWENQTGWVQGIGAYVTSSFAGGIVTGQKDSGAVYEFNAIDPSGTTHELESDSSSPNIFHSIDGTGYTFTPTGTGNAYDPQDTENIAEGMYSSLPSINYWLSNADSDALGDHGGVRRGTLSTPTGIQYTDTIVPFSTATPLYEYNIPRALMSTAKDPAGNTITRGPWYWSGYYSLAGTEFGDIGTIYASSSTPPRYIDSVNRPIPDIVSMQATMQRLSASQPPSLTWTVPGPQGNNLTYVINYQLVANSHTWHPDPTGSILPVGATISAPDPTTDLTAYGWGISSIALPNGGQSNGPTWTFKYYDGTENPSAPETSASGDIKEIDTPTGASVSYTFATVPITLGSSGARCDAVCHAVLSRTESAGAGQPPLTTYYSYGTYNISSNPLTATMAANCAAGPLFAVSTTVTDPAGNDTVHTFCSIQGEYHEIQVDYYSGCVAAANGCGNTSGRQLLKSVSTSYSGYLPDIPLTVSTGQHLGLVNMFPTQITSTTPAGSSTVTRQYSPMFTTTRVGCVSGLGHACTLPVNFVSPTTEKMYSGTSATGTPLRTTTTSFEFQETPNAYTAANIIAIPLSVQNLDSVGNPLAKTTYFYDDTTPSPGPFGNLTTVKRWLGTTQYVSTKTWYNTFGPSKSEDANGNDTLVSGFMDQCSTGALNYSQSVTAAYGSTSTVPETSNYLYDCNTGAVTSATDPNDVTTKYIYTDSSGHLSDSLGRLTQIQYNVTGTTSQKSETSIVYRGMTEVDVAQDQTLLGDGNIKSATFYDGWGRVVQQIDPAGNSVCTTYNAAGQVATVTNPVSSCSSTSPHTAYSYDALGRTVEETEQDGNSIWLSYDGVHDPSGPQAHYSTNAFRTLAGAVSWVDSTDEAGNHHQQISNALGQQIASVEPDPQNGNTLSLETDYGYDGNGNLASISQLGKGLPETSHVRAFNYDWLSRLVQAYNPESGWTCYGTTLGSAPPDGTNCTEAYDGNSNLSYKTDARGVFTHIGYDGLNRPLYETSSDGSVATSYSYDNAISSPGGIGRLYQDLAGTTGNAYLYDAMGRVTTKSSKLPSMNGSWSTINASYDLAGNLNQLTYPDGRAVQQNSDNAGHITGISYASWNGTNMNQPLFTADQSGDYDSAGHLISAALGTSVVYSAGYDYRQRIQALGYGPTSAPLWSKQYGWASNGNLQTITDQVSGVQRQFGYDSLNRLTNAQDILAGSGGTGSGSGGACTTGTAAGTGSSSGATPQWTNPDDSNVLINPDVPGASGWIISGASVAANSIVAPDGTSSATAVTSNSSDGYVTDFAAEPYSFSGETMSGSVWLRSTTGTQTINVYLTENLPGSGGVAGWKQVQLTTAWQQVQVSGTVQGNLTSLALQIGGGGSVTSGQGFVMWNPMVEDDGMTDGSVTNFLPYSQRLTTYNWAGSATVTITDDAVAAPDGTNTGSTVTATGGDSTILGYVPNPAPYSGVPVTGSIWLRVPAGSQSVLVTLTEVGASGWQALGYQMVTLNTSWQRFQVSGTTQSTLTSLLLEVGGAGSFTSGQTVNVWGAQMELASNAGPYVATGASPTTAGMSLTNLLPYSQQLTGSSWPSTSNFSFDSNTVIAPDGSATATEVTGTASDSNLLNHVQNPGLYNNATLTASIFLRAPAGTPTVNLYLYSHNASGASYFAPQTVTLSQAWQRFEVTGVAPNGLDDLAIQIGGAGSIGVGKTFDVWGSQIEIAPLAGPYVATNVLPVLAGRELTNILPNSQQLSGPSWGVSYGSAALNSATAPDGSATAATVTANSGSPDTFAIDNTPNPSLYDGLTVTGSVYLRVASGTLNMNIYLINIGENGWGVPAYTPVTLTTTWQRFSVTGANQNGLAQLALEIGGAGMVTSGQSFQIWGPQLVVGSDPAPYSPTSCATTVYATGQPGTLVTNGLNEAYAYDSFGNILQNGGFNVSYTAQNQMFGYPYDAAGNLEWDGLWNTMTWDAESRLKTVAGATYVYDAEGNRVEKQGVGVTDTVYFGGKPVARLSAGQWTDLIYGPTGLLAEIPGTQNGAPVFRVTDHLGTTVGNLLANGTLVNPVDYTPFGQVFSGNTDDPYRFTGYERDAESGFDYASARQYANNTGRFISPDPSGLAYADQTNPQSFNLYSYALNNPLKYIDPTGLDECKWDAGDKTDPEDHLDNKEACEKAGGNWFGNTDTTVTIRPDGNSGCSGDCGEDPMQWLYDWELSQYLSRVPQQPAQISPEAQAFIAQVAKKTAGFPTVCSVGAYVQVGGGPLSAGASYDSNSGGKGNVAQTPVQVAPFSVTVKKDTKGTVSGTATVRDPVTGVGGGVSVNDKGTPTVSVSEQRGPVTVGATATLGTIGNPQCQHR